MSASMETWNRPGDALRAIVAGGLAAGTFDLCAATLAYTSPSFGPQRLFQYIAAGWLGRAAEQGGNTSAALGIVSHYGILLVAAALFYAASRHLADLRRRFWLYGPLYGIAIYVVMSFVVVPLSALPYPRHYSLSSVALGVFIHMLCVGTPIAYAVRRFAP